MPSLSGRLIPTARQSGTGWAAESKTRARRPADLSSYPMRSFDSTVKVDEVLVKMDMCPRPESSAVRRIGSAIEALRHERPAREADRACRASARGPAATPDRGPGCAVPSRPCSGGTTPRAPSPRSRMYDHSPSFRAPSRPGLQRQTVRVAIRRVARDDLGQRGIRRGGRRPCRRRRA